jgi:hypothetical protein
MKTRLIKLSRFGSINHRWTGSGAGHGFLANKQRKLVKTPVTVLGQKGIVPRCAGTGTQGVRVPRFIPENATDDLDRFISSHALFHSYRLR